jgi:hypothetical protein
VRLEGLGQLKNPVTSPGFEPAQCLNQLRYHVPQLLIWQGKIFGKEKRKNCFEIKSEKMFSRRKCKVKAWVVHIFLHGLLFYHEYGGSRFP